MRYENLSLLEKSLSSQPPQKYPPVYLILGKDSFEQQETVEFLFSRLLPPGEKRELAVAAFDGAHLDEGVFYEALDAYSFFVRSQIILVHHFDKPKKGVQESVEQFLSHPRPGQFLILCAASCSKASSLYKAIDKVGVVIEFAELKPWEKEKQLVDWVNKRAAAARKLMSYQVCQLFVKRAGTDKALLVQELEKLFCYCLDKQEIGTRDVEAICAREHGETIWALGEAIFRRDAFTALQIGKEFLLDGQPFLSLLRQMRTQFQTGYQIALMLAQGKHGEEITHLFPYMKGQILQRNIQQAQQYGVQAFKAGILAIDHTELEAKNSSVDDALLLELLLFSLTRTRP